MRLYELVVLIHPDLEIDIDAPISKIVKIIEAAGGKIVKRDNWGKKRLAYRLGGQDFAVYVSFALRLEPDSVRPVGQAIQLTDEVLRHLLVAGDSSSSSRKPKPAPAGTSDQEMPQVQAEVAEVKEGVK
jgi:small subunit ribosomal protein S6